MDCSTAPLGQSSSLQTERKGWSPDGGIGRDQIPIAPRGVHPESSFRVGSQLQRKRPVAGPLEACTTSRAPAAGLPESAYVTRPERNWAGYSVAVSGLDVGAPSLSKSMACRAKRGSLIPSVIRYPRPRPRMVKRPSASVIAELRPAGGTSFGGTLPSLALEPVLSRCPDRLRSATHCGDSKLDVRHRTSLHIEQPPLDHLLWQQRDISLGLFGVGSSWTHAAP